MGPEPCLRRGWVCSCHRRPGRPLTYGLNAGSRARHHVHRAGDRRVRRNDHRPERRENDLIINVTKGKKLTNIRSSTSDFAIQLVPPFSLAWSSRWASSKTMSCWRSHPKRCVIVRNYLHATRDTGKVAQSDRVLLLRGLGDVVGYYAAGHIAFASVHSFGCCRVAQRRSVVL